MINIVFGLYNGYKSLRTDNGGIFYFITSLRKYNKDCKIVILCEKHNIFHELVTFAQTMNFEIYSNFKCKYNMMYYRFEIYKQYLDTLTQINIEIDKILMTDINDVIFQNDPFTINFTENIYCALEQNILSDVTNSSSRLNMQWIQDIYNKPTLDNQTLEKYKNKYVICAGTILCTYTGAIDYLNFYISIMNKRIVNDQGLLNVYIYTILDSSLSRCDEYKKSKILTLDKIPFNILNISNNTIKNDLDEPYIIIHQINRCNLPFMLSLVTA